MQRSLFGNFTEEGIWILGLRSYMQCLCNELCSPKQITVVFCFKAFMIKNHFLALTVVR